MANYVVTTAGGLIIRISGTLDAAASIEREFFLLFGEPIIVRKEKRT